MIFVALVQLLVCLFAKYFKKVYTYFDDISGSVDGTRYRLFNFGDDRNLYFRFQECLKELLSF